DSFGPMLALIFSTTKNFIISLSPPLKTSSASSRCFFIYFQFQTANCHLSKQNFSDSLGVDTCGRRCDGLNLKIQMARNCQLIYAQRVAIARISPTITDYV
ncbi:MAG TPA: hypothetical protein VJN71_02410, partial [Nitrososphaerales archaeon]|nr:hypothetical protein [Nitrososphaerales archaeon]